ncbi:hypothetical protein LOZ51_006315 [Ophidiomyces ophidiicola]|nr:hypothetical protein LOZ51_006315 [Ophidiomyces ophidiicola]
MASPGKPAAPLSASLPALIMGSATFNSQYNPDPYALPTASLVHKALAAGVRAFDTSPYYGPAEELLGQALDMPFVRDNYPRSSYHLLTKVGRIAAASFDYSPAWIRRSLARSLVRLKTPYLDVVYCHDVEFVSADEVLVAVRELRRIRDTEGTVRYVGISGYPVDVLCDLAEMILRETGEPLDAVMSFANFTVQNTRLVSEGVPRLLAAGVDVVPNASPLGMGLLRRSGVPIGSMGDFHPAPVELRQAVSKASDWTEAQGHKIESIAIQFALVAWLTDGSPVGSYGELLAPQVAARPPSTQADHTAGLIHGVSVMGVSTVEELEETLSVWRRIIDGLDTGAGKENPEGEHSSVKSQAEILKNNRQRILPLVEGIQKILGPQWVNYAWPSPDTGFVNQPPPAGYDKDTVG